MVAEENGERPKDWAIRGVIFIPGNGGKKRQHLKHTI